MSCKCAFCCMNALPDETGETHFERIESHEIIIWGKVSGHFF